MLPCSIFSCIFVRCFHICFKYYTIHEFHKLVTKSKKSNTLSLIHSNICSINANFENLETFLIDTEFKFDVITLSETWPPSNKAKSFTPPILPGYHNYIGNTGTSAKSGCGIYLNKDLNYIPRKDLNVSLADTSFEIETCWIEIINNNKPNTLVGVVYRHPHKNDTNSIDLLNNTIKKINKENKQIILSGDFN